MIRWTRSVAVVAIVALAMVAATEVPAHAASWGFGDGFENNPAASWSIENPDASSRAEFDDYSGDGPPHTGNAYAELFRSTAGWNSIDRSLTLPSWHRVCSVQAYVQEAPGTQFNLEIIDPSNWTYVTMHTYTLPNDYAWHQYTLAWYGGPNSAVLRIVVLSNRGFERIKVDDVTVACVS